MEKILKIMTRMAMVGALLMAGFAVGFPVGQHRGFTTGIECALIEADILAREAHVRMPFYFRDGEMRVVVKQPHDLYKRAWQQSDKHDTEMEYWNKGKKSLTQRIAFSRGANPLQ